MVAMVLGVCLPIESAWSQTSGQQMEAVRQRMEDGLALFVAGNAEAAAATFEQGYRSFTYSAFLFNAAVCYEKLRKHPDALARYQEYMRVDADAPDIDEVRRRVARLEAIVNPPTPPEPDPDAAVDPDAGVDPDAPSEPAESEPSEPVVPTPPSDLGSETMRSLVIVESEPAGAPVRVFRPASEHSPPFDLGGENSQWTEIVTTTAPTSLSLGVGLYHIVIDKYKEYNPSDTKLRVSPGHVHHFKANLSQGAFMAFLRVSGNVRGARVWLDDPKKSKPEWGTTPYGELVESGEHEVLIEAPGFQSLKTQIELQSGERKEIEVKLERVDYGFLRIDADLLVDREKGLGYDQGEPPQVQMFLDGKPRGVWRLGQKPVELKASAGSHQLTVSADGYKDFKGRVIVPKGQVLPLNVRMIPRYPRGGAWTQAILAAGFLGAGAYLGTESENLKDELDAERARGALQADDSRITQGRWFAIGADVGFAAGTVLGLLATWNFIKDPLPESSLRPSEPVEFPDPLKARPTAVLRMPSPTRPLRFPGLKPAAARILSANPPIQWTVSPQVATDAAGIALGGTF